mgnify:CR=1 FL=1
MFASISAKPMVSSIPELFGNLTVFVCGDSVMLVDVLVLLWLLKGLSVLAATGFPLRLAPNLLKKSLATVT